jgi:hypothetical protein
MKEQETTHEQSSIPVLLKPSVEEDLFPVFLKNIVKVN